MTFSLNAIISEIFLDRYLKIQEGEGYNRSVMPLEALGSTRNTIFIIYIEYIFKYDGLILVNEL